jgi:virulence factor Mce-like protein
MKYRRRSRVSNFRAGIIGAIVVGLLCYLVFGGALPFSGSRFVLKAVFRVSTNLHVPSPVRIAGVNVGQVTDVRRLSAGSDAALITMQIDRNGLPIHADATAKIRPRIFLEGNFYLELRPGSTTAPVLRSGQTLPVANTAGPVQLDRVLSALDANTRASLQTLLQGAGAALNGQPTTAEDAVQDPTTRGLTAAQSLNGSLRYSADALRASAIVNQALLGLQPRDLSQLVKGNEELFRALASRQDQLAGLVTSFNATTAAFASRQAQLSQTIALLPALLRSSLGAFDRLDASFAPTRAFAREILPGVGETDSTIGAALPWLAQARGLLSRAELGGLLQRLTPATRDTASTLGSATGLVSALDQLNLCFLHNVIPTGNAVIQDPPLGHGIPVYQEFFQTAVGLAGASQGFDGNGRYLRFQTGGGPIPINTSPLPTEGPLRGNALRPVLGTRPAWPGQPPPKRRNVPCLASSAPNLNAARTGAAP